MIVVPKRYSYCEAYLVLRCGFHCPWCINVHGELKRNRKELSGREWVIGLNNLKIDGLPVTLGGGEPTMHPAFFDILNNVNQKFDLLTNASFDLKKFLKRTNPDMFYVGGEAYYKSIRISFHPGQSDAKRIIDASMRLSDAGYSVGIFGTNYPDNLRANNEFAEKARRAGIFFFIRDYLGFYNDRLYGDFFYIDALNGNRKPRMCRTEELLIGPEGDVYQCHKRLYEGNRPVGNILNMAYEIEDVFRPCLEFGTCNECDVKKKLGPDLTKNKCSIEIKGIK